MQADDRADSIRESADPEPGPGARARRHLLDELRRIRGRLDAAEATALSILMDHCVTGGAPPLTGLEAQRMLAGLRERDAARVRVVIAALARIDDGTWGACEACGAAIDEERLDVLPEATTCAACAREAR